LGKTVRFSSPAQFMAQRKSTIDEAWAGDIVGLPDNQIFKIGDTLTEGENLHFRGLPSFSPELFKYIENGMYMQHLDGKNIEVKLSEQEEVAIKKTIFSLGFFNNLQYYMIHNYKSNRIE
jgi:peptide subunit release factor RF-3